MLLQEEKKRQDFIVILKVIACILITNSHCRDIYPYFFLAVGGGHGNALFFGISGFCLANIHQPFRQWYLKRINRILPATVVVIFLCIFFAEGIQYFSQKDFVAILSFFINKYWFVPAILIYYIFFYFLFKKKDIKVLKYAFLCYFLLYAALYLVFVDKGSFSIELEGFSPFKVYFYFGVFLLGGYLSLQRKEIQSCYQNSKKIQILLWILLATSIILWCSVYSMILLLQKGYAVQFLIHAAILTFSGAIFFLAILYSSKISLSQGAFNRVMNVIADSTLEIYLVQVTFKSVVTGVSFPANWIVFFSIAFGGGIILHVLLEKLFFKKNK